MPKWNVQNTGPQWLMDADGRMVGYKDRRGREYTVLQGLGQSGDSESRADPDTSLVSRAGNLATLTAPGLLSGVTYDSSNRAVQWTIDGVTYSANYSIAAINVAGSDGTITNISVDPAQRITAVATA